jgi:gliding motility-associated-like protein
MKSSFVFIALVSLLSISAEAQNLVPNPSFETMEDCEFIQPDLSCLQFWNEYLALDPVNTPDLGYEGAVFFPPSTIPAHDGNQYLNIECSTGNPEYIQVDLLQPMAAGTTYCVSFYASHSEESPEVAPSLGVYFTNEPVTDSPHDLDLDAHVQGPVNFDHTSWTLISGTYIAQGGEDILVLAGFENTGTMPFPYMYVDFLSVVPMPPLLLNDVELCEDEMIIDAFAQGASYSWNTGATTSSIAVNAAGEYQVIRTIGVCTQDATFQVLTCESETDITDPQDTIPNDTIVNPVDDPATDPVDVPVDIPLSPDQFVFYVPNAFTPDGDGLNDVFGASGPETDAFELMVFNRWGELVFRAEHVDQRWTGNHSSGAYYVPDGIYTYLLKAAEGTMLFEKRGHVVMLR